VSLNASQGLGRTTRSAPEYETALEQLSRIVPALRFDLGVMLDVSGERLHVVDSTGRRVPQMQMLAALACLVFRAYEGAAVAVPVDAPAVFESLAARHGGKIIRTRLDAEGIMSAAGQKGVRLAGDGRGRTIFTALHTAFDAMFSLAKLLELLSTSNTRLTDVIADLPDWHIEEADVPCPWDKKGAVMRLLGEQYRDRRARAADGIKINLGDEWVLVLPDPDEPQFHLVAEGKTETEAHALINKYGSIVTGLQR
jgi:mannose-1-phosphate guanylyltransferase/phosphomannomutase